MNTNEMLSNVQNRFDHLMVRLRAKNAEYSREDALSNFKCSGAAQKCSPERALLGMVTKHWTSVVDMVHDASLGIRHSSDAWFEKTGDIAVYMMLLQMLADEREQAPQLAPVLQLATKLPLAVLEALQRSHDYFYGVHVDMDGARESVKQALEMLTDADRERSEAPVDAVPAAGRNGGWDAGQGDGREPGLSPTDV